MGRSLKLNDPPNYRQKKHDISYPIQLCIEIRKVAALQKRIVREIDSADEITGAKSNLLRLGKVLIDVTVEFKFPDILHRNQFLGPNFRRVKDIKVKSVRFRFLQRLNSKFPSWVGTVVDCAVKIFAMEVWILAADLEGFIPDKGVDAEFRGQMKFDECPLVLLVDEAIGIDSEPLHHAVTAGNGPDISE